MKFFIFPLFLALALGVKADEIEKEDSGFYWKKYDSFGVIVYQVDPITKLCFASNIGGPKGFTVIDCKNLAKRPEWQKVITWVD